MMHDKKKLRRVTLAAAAAVILAGILLLALLLKPVPELSVGEQTAVSYSQAAALPE